MSEASALFCTFRLQGQLFGVPILDVKEVTTQTVFTRIAHAPPAVRGYVNLRGHIQLILDLRQLLGLPPAPVTADSRLVIFKPSVGDAFGVLVDAIGEIVAVERDQIEERRTAEAEVEDASSEGHSGSIVAGVAKLPGELLILLHPRRFLAVVAAAMNQG